MNCIKASNRLSGILRVICFIAKILKASPVTFLDLDQHLPKMANEPPAEYKNVSKQLHLLTNKIDTFQHIIEKQKKEIQSLRESIGRRKK